MSSASRAALPARQTRPRRWLTRLLGVLFVLALPLCLVTNNVRWVTLDPATYRRGFEKYRAAERTGLDPAQLAQIAEAFIAYFQGPPGELNPTVRLSGANRPLFSEREVHHMVDVQLLMHWTFRLGIGAAVFLLLVAASQLALLGSDSRPMLGRRLIWGSGLTLVLLLLVGSLSMLDFDELFLRFHQMSFRNDLWMLDPRTDYLIMLFPQGFWFDVTVRIALLTVGEAVVLGTLGYLLARR